MVDAEQWLVGEPQFLNPNHVRFAFHGKLEQQPVVWQCNLYTLHYYACTMRAAEQRSLQQHILIDTRTAYHIEVALQLPHIDRGAMRKTIIMVRNYKRLHRGEHCFGEYYQQDCAKAR